MVTIFKAQYFNGARYEISWHGSGEAAWRHMNDQRGIVRSKSVEPIDVIVTRDGLLRLLNKVTGVAA